MSLTQARINSLNKREIARWEEARVALSDPADLWMHIKDEITSQKKIIDKLHAAVMREESATRKRIMRETFEQDLWPILVEKLRCKGVAVEGHPPQPERPAAGLASRQATINELSGMQGGDDE